MKLTTHLREYVTSRTLHADLAWCLAEFNFTSYLLFLNDKKYI